MMEFLYQLDLSTFYFINQTLSNGVFDVVMPAITNVKHFYPLYALLFIILLWKGGNRGRWCALFLVIAVAVADPISSRVLKEEIGRERPCRKLHDVHLLVNCGGGKSFPSSHAVNNFAGFIVFASFFSRFAWIWLIMAVSISFSRVYVGVHYPSDVLAGAVIGMIIGGLVVLTGNFVRSRYDKVKFETG